MLESPKYQYVWGPRHDDELVCRDDRYDTLVEELNDGIAGGGSGSSGGRQYQHHNRGWSVRAVTDETGAVLERYLYDPHGKPTVLNAAGTAVLANSQLPGGEQDYGYTNQRYDRETGLWYFKHRYLDDALGRFISRDPAGYVDGMNLYTAYFVLTGTDPLGLNQKNRNSTNRNREESEISKWIDKEVNTWIRGSQGVIADPGGAASTMGSNTNEGYGDPVGAVAEIAETVGSSDQPIRDSLGIAGSAAWRGPAQGAMDGANKATDIWDGGVGLVGKATGTDTSGAQLGGWADGKLVPPSEYNNDFGGEMVFGGTAGILETGIVGKILGAGAVDETLPVLNFSSQRNPQLVDNIRNAQAAGHPSVLTHGGDAAANRAAALDGVPNIRGSSRDEYPFASSMEGGGGSWVGHIPASQQNSQGGIMSNFFRRNNIQAGDRYRVTTTND